jgi:hypothetical protein
MKGAHHWRNLDTAQAGTDNGALDYGRVIDVSDVHGEAMFLVTSTMHPAGFSFDAPTTAGFLLAFEEDKNERRRQGLDPAGVAAKKAEVDVSGVAPFRAGSGETMRKMPTGDKADLGRMIDDAFDDYSVDGNKRMLGFFSMADGRVLQDIYHRLHKVEAFKDLLQTNYYLELCMEIQANLRAVGCEISQEDILRTGHGVRTLKTLSKFVESTVGSSRSMADDVIYEYVGSESGNKRTKIEKETDTRVSKGIRTAAQLDKLKMYLTMIGTGFHGRQFERAMAGVSVSFAKLTRQTGNDAAVLKRCVDELWNSYTNSVRRCISKAISTKAHCGDYFSANFGVLGEEFDEVTARDMVLSATGQALAESRAQTRAVLSRMDQLEKSQGGGGGGGLSKRQRKKQRQQQAREDGVRQHAFKFGGYVIADKPACEQWCKNHQYNAVYDAVKAWRQIPGNRDKCFWAESECGQASGGCGVNNCKFCRSGCGSDSSDDEGSDSSSDEDD